MLNYKEFFNKTRCATRSIGCRFMDFFMHLSPERKAALLWLLLEKDLKQAIKNEELEIYYQPVVDLKTGHISGMEALLRWQHPCLGLIPPVDLMPLIKASNLEKPIEDWVLESACLQAAKWHKESLQSSSLRLSINLSLHQLRDKKFLETLDRAIRLSGIDPTLLVLELSQTSVLEKEDIKKLYAIVEKGIGLSMDDFGTATSKWRDLSAFGTIKIDNQFTQMINNEKEDSRQLVSAMCKMADNLGLKILAEGVETEGQYQYLKGKELDFIQGFYFSKPLNKKDFEVFLKNPH